MRFRRERLDVARMRVVGFVAMHVDEPALFRGDTRTARRTDARRRPSCARNAECRRRRRRRVAAHAAGSPRPSPSGATGRPAETRRVAGRDTARRDASLRRSASTASRRSSQMSTWLRIASRPCATAMSQYCERAIDDAPAGSDRGFSSPHSAMPSSSVPERLTPRQAERQRRIHVGVRIDERRRRDGRQRRSPRTPGAASCGATAAMRPSRTATSTSRRPSGRLAWRRIRSMASLSLAVE